jgi:surfeit locus 1 family protein
MTAQTGSRRRLLPVSLLLVLALGFAALGIWQIERLAWKEALIADVTRALHAAPVTPAALPAGPIDKLLPSRRAFGPLPAFRHGPGHGHQHAGQWLLGHGAAG